MPDRSPETPASTSGRHLPADVRRLVAEIEAGEDEGPALGDGNVPVPAGARPRSNGRIEHAVRQILTEIGEDPQREGLLRTPERMHRMWLELTCGYQVDPERLINGAVFDVGYSEMVVVRDIEFYSLCEHHML
ncbi:MAG TPA: GTP cyclohydrolase I, partial [Candidatus Limnocylindrales bacterium]